MKPTAQLAALGAYAERLMVPAHLWRKTEQADAGGGSTVAWARQADVEVQLVAPSGSEREAAAQQGVEVTHTAVLRLNTPARRGDRLVVDGTTVELVSGPVVATHSAVARSTAKQEHWDEPVE